MTYHGIKIPKAQISDFCRRNHVLKLALFGSILRKDFRPESDIDLVVEFDPENDVSLLDMARIRQQLGDVLHRSIDLLTRSGVKGMRNHLRKREVLRRLRSIYAA